MVRVVVPKAHITRDFEVVFTEEEQMGWYDELKAGLFSLQHDINVINRRLDELEHPTVPELPTGCTFAEAMEGVVRGEEWRRAGWTNSSANVGRCRRNCMVVWQSSSRAGYSPTITDVQATDWMRVK